MDDKAKLATLERIGDGRGIVFDDDPVAKVGPKGYVHGWIKVDPGETAAAAEVFPEIGRADLSAPDGRRSRSVSSAEFQRLAAEGKRRLTERQAHHQAPTGLDEHWAAIKEEAAVKAHKSWGGETWDAHTGRAVDPHADRYALTMRTPGKEPLHLPEDASDADIATAMDEARRRFADELSVQGAHLGIFHDDDLHEIDIDPVLVVDSLDDVETIGAYTHAVGGAYHFADGDGYWPPHVEEAKAAAASPVHFEGIGQWHSQARRAQG